MARKNYNGKGKNQNASAAAERTGRGNSASWRDEDKKASNADRSSGSNSKNRGRARQDNRRGGSRSKGDIARTAVNDISWYSRYPNLLLAAGSFPYPYRPGMDLPLGQIAYPTTEGNIPFTDISLNIPGVMSLDWLPSIGKSETSTDPASVVGKEIYAKVRAVFSGTLRADAPDYVIYLMALDSVFSYIAWLKRLYRTLSAWNPENYAIPEHLLRGMRITTADVQSLRAGKTQLWQYINELVLMSRKFTCPAIMDVFNRHYWMSDNVYCDANTIRSQMYLFNLVGCYKFELLDNGEGAKVVPGLTMIPLPNISALNSAVPLTPGDFFEFGRSLIDALVAWDAAYDINGYLQKAYEGAAQFVVNELAYDEVIAPVYSEEVLMQIENSRTVPGNVSYTKNSFAGMNIGQDIATNAVVATPCLTVREVQTIYKSGVAYGNPVLSIRSDNPTVADSVVASRLICYPTKATGSGSEMLVFFDCGTELPLRWNLVREHDNPGGDTTISPNRATGLADVFSQQQFYEINTTSVVGAAALINQMLNVGQFDWHPLCFVYSGTLTGSGATLAAEYDCVLLGDTHNITAISKHDLENLHVICLFSELNAFDA